MPKVSVIVPIYNVEKYLEKCLTTLQNQTFSDIEIFCVNDGTKDNSQDIVDRFAAKDSRFIPLIKENGGLSDARNFALPHVTGDYIAFVDSDDFVEEDMIKALYERAIKDDLDLVICDFYQYYVETGDRECLGNRFSEDKVYRLEETPELLCYVNNCAWNKLYRASLFKDTGIRFEKGLLYEDLPNTTRMLYLADKIGFVNKPLYNYLSDRPNNIMTTSDERVYHILKVEDIYLNFYKEHNVFEKYYEELKYVSVINIMSILRKTPTYKDYKFAEKFVDDCFDFINKYFPDYPKGKYPFYSYDSDKVYLNRTKLKWYLRYRRVFK